MFSEILVDPDWLRGIIGMCEALAVVQPGRRATYFPAQSTEPLSIRTALLRRGTGSRVYFHEWLRSDPDDLHDHQYDNTSVILDVGYWEVTRSGRRWLGPGSVIARRAEDPHRVEIDPDKPHPKSLFITGDVCRGWGYYTPSGWRPWYDYWPISAVEHVLAQIVAEERAPDPDVQEGAEFMRRVIEHRREKEQHV